MATFRLRRFSCPETLRSIHPRHLVEFLSPYAEFLAPRGVALPDDGAGLDYQRLAGIFVSPEADTPKELIDALYFVDELATPMGMDALLAEAEHHGVSVTVGDGQSPADIAVQVWLADSNLIERKHAEAQILRRKSFEYFQAQDHRPSGFDMPDRGALQTLERELDEWFVQHNRGSGARVFAFPKDDGVWFLVRHGEPYKREGSLEGGESSSVHFRPEKYDIVVYQPAVGELRINAGSKGEKQLYRRQFGKHLFTGEDHFPGTNKYTLEPLREYGAAALNCIDIEGIEWIKLKEYQLLFPGNPWEIVIRKSDDVFASLEARRREIPDGGRLIGASFQVKFSDCKTPRSVVIRPSNIAQFTRDDDAALVEQWLSARGFIVDDETAELRRPAPLLASA